jgi:hypothetical protein
VANSVVEIQEKALAQTPSLAAVQFEPGSECTTIAEDIFWITGLEQLLLPGKVQTL